LDVICQIAKLDDEAYERRAEGDPANKSGDSKGNRKKRAKSTPDKDKKKDPRSNPNNKKMNILAKDMKCWSCGRPGHSKSDCWHLQEHQKDWSTKQWKDHIEANGYPNARKKSDRGKAGKHINRVMTCPICPVLPKDADGEAYISDHTTDKSSVIVQGWFKFDSGSSHNVIGLQYAMSLRTKLGSKFIDIEPYHVIMADGSKGICSNRIKLDITIETVVGKTRLPRGLVFDIVPDQGPEGKSVNSTILLCDAVLESMGVETTMQRVMAKQKEARLKTEARQIRVAQPESDQVHYAGMTDADLDRFHAEIMPDERHMRFACSVRIGRNVHQPLKNSDVVEASQKKADAPVGLQDGIAYVSQKRWQAMSPTPYVLDDSIMQSYITTTALADRRVSWETTKHRVAFLKPEHQQLLQLAEQRLIGSAVVDKIYVLKGGPSAHLVNKLTILTNLEVQVVEGEANLVLLGYNAIEGLKTDDELQVRLERATPTLDKDEIEQALEERLAEARLEGLSSEHLARLKSLCYQYVDLWRVKLSPQDRITSPPVFFQLKEGATPPKGSYQKRFAADEARWMEAFLQELQDSGIVREEHTNWIAPVHLVSKKPLKGSTAKRYRMVVDFRHLNSWLELSQYPIPRLEDLQEYLLHAKYFFTIDGTNGFYQLKVHEDCVRYLGFRANGRIFVFLALPMGIAIAPQSFQRVLSSVTAPLQYRLNKGKGVVCYIDDVGGGGGSVTDCIDVLEKVFKKLDHHNIKISPHKVVLCTKKLLYGGKEISAAGIRPKPEVIEAVRKMPLPRTADELLSFLAAMNWLRASMPYYSTIAAEAYECVNDAYEGKKRRTKRAIARVVLDTLPRWNEKGKASYHRVKEALLNAVTLAIFDPTKLLYVWADASTAGWALILTQLRKAERELPVLQQKHSILYCASGRFKGAQLNYSVSELEAYALCVELHKFQHYLRVVHEPAILCTDHKVLVSIFDAAGQSNLDMTATRRARLTRWCLKLMSYRYEILHCPGIHYVLVIQPIKRRSKLLYRYGGPYVVTKILSSHVYQVKLMGEDSRTQDCHVSRILRYASKSFGQELSAIQYRALMEDAARDLEAFQVEGFLNCEFNEDDGQWKLLTKWKGFTEEENSWEPLTTLYEDVPAMVLKYLNENKYTKKHVDAMLKGKPHALRQ